MAAKQGLDSFEEPGPAERREGFGRIACDLRGARRSVPGRGQQRWPCIAHQRHGTDVFSADDLEGLRAATTPTMLVDPDPGLPRRVALLPGSFDPITVAHAALADAARDWADLVVLVYSVRTVPKDVEAEPPLLAEPERIQALTRFCAARPGTAVGLCSHGLLVDHVRAAAERFPPAELAVVVGSDKVVQLFDPAWYEDHEAALDELFGRATVLYAIREGEADAVRATLSHPANVRWQVRLQRIDVAPEVAAVSSRMVRSLLRRGDDMSHLLPPGVQVRGPGNSHLES
jgi:nicotinic acid mononucleotide adenylyltransferase